MSIDDFIKVLGETNKGKDDLTYLNNSPKISRLERNRTKSTGHPRFHKVHRVNYSFTRQGR